MLAALLVVCCVCVFFAAMVFPAMFLLRGASSRSLLSL